MGQRIYAFVNFIDIVKLSSAMAWFIAEIEDNLAILLWSALLCFYGINFYIDEYVKQLAPSYSADGSVSTTVSENSLAVSHAIKYIYLCCCIRVQSEKQKGFVTGIQLWITIKQPL